MSSSNSLRVGVLFGGRSGEHEVSLQSAANVMDALRRAGHAVTPIGITPRGKWLTHGDPMAQLSDGRTASNGNGESDAWALLPNADSGEPLPAIDVIFPVLHGPYGEDGTIQGLLEMANLPYVGCGVLSSAVAMDKAVAKMLFAQAGLPQAEYRVVRRKQWRREREAVLSGLAEALGTSLFIKPANLGSSVGISRADDRNELADALDLAARYDSKLVVEAAVPNAREIEISVLGNDEPVASVAGEIVPGDKFYSYADKYLNDKSQALIPAPLREEQAARIREMALLAFRTVEGAGLARVDFLLDDAADEIFLNEINTMPGFTRISMYPKLWEASGVSYAELVDRLLHLALEHHGERQENRTVR
ncbi:MAG: D-alanine--D-alanine ligase [Caldilineaceae bacterium]|nr:D-alanine--D-alanine ligase [Caldilineaceae bacterium]